MKPPRVFLTRVKLQAVSKKKIISNEHIDHANHEKKKNEEKNLKVQSNLPRKDSLGSGDRGTWPTIAGRCPLFRDQNKSECVRRNKQKNPVA